MKRIHLLRYDGAPDALADLIEAAAADGLRVGWLEGAGEPPTSPAAPSAPSRLMAAAGAGAFRSVALAPERAVAVKRLAGPPVLRDVLREHFLGCALVVAAAGTPFEADLAGEPTLAAVDGGYRITAEGAAGRVFTTAELVARLRRPRPWS